MVDQVRTDKPTTIIEEGISKEYLLQLLDSENSAILIARNLRISAVGIEAKVIGKIVKDNIEELAPFTLYYNGKFVAEEIIDDE